MNFKNFAKVSLLGMAALCVSCNGGENKQPVSVASNGAPSAQTTKTLTIAYVELDSIQSQYQFFIDAKAEMEAKSQKYDKELNRLGKNLQNAAAQFQDKLQKGGFSSQAQAEGAQKALLSQQGQLEQKQSMYAQELASQQMEFNQALEDSINSFLSEYNKVHNYSMILSKGNGNIMMADKSMDITADVIEGLNKRYGKKGK